MYVCTHVVFLLCVLNLLICKVASLNANGTARTCVESKSVLNQRFKQLVEALVARKRLFARGATYCVLVVYLHNLFVP